MPSVKIPKKSTFVDMTPFVDVAFLILTFFIMATKFKPPEPVEIKTPESVSSQEVPENDAVQVTIDPKGRVFFSVLSANDKSIPDQLIQSLNTSRNLGLSPAEMANYKKVTAIGMPFNKLKGYLALGEEQMKAVKPDGIPVLDTLNNELVWWIQSAKVAFAGRKLKFLVKGDEQSTYPTFEAVIAALKKNDEFKFNLITGQEGVPANSELDVYNRTREK